MEQVAANTTASEIAAAPIGQTVKDVLITAKLATEETAPPNSDKTNVYVGTLKVPYYGDVATTANPTAILSSYWKADRNVFEENTPFVGSPIDGCKSYSYLKTKTDVPISTTTCFPMPAS
jgi:hypothetical protein